MSFLFFSCNRCYVKSSVICRHLSTFIFRPKSNQISHFAYRNSLYTLLKARDHYENKRSVTLNAPSIDENQSSIRNENAPFQFPPGKPNDKPRLEHLRFIESQLKRIVNRLFCLIILFDQFLYF